ncbi:hypothetical protein [Terricaulis sp.]|uniref:hypothetical protein n=1 Tax=Terricaulis sp. TaxID=2768686 RepID=UPI0037841818
MKYSICFLDASGRTVRSEVMPLAGDAAAARFAIAQLPQRAIIEVWKEYGLLTRLFRDKQTISPMPTAKAELLAQNAPNREIEGRASS